ncbi:MAG: threonine--tRNA ligase [Clostridia bacterium]|nr:threonine--tRNA ligase [Clostridia bacterium]
MKIQLRDETREFEKGTTILEIASSISEGLARVAVAGRVDGVLTDLSVALEDDCALEIVTQKDPEAKQILRHTAAHVLAQAVKTIYPTAKLSIGPATEDGFYYDFDFKTPITVDDLPKIEAEMKKIIKANFEIKRNVVTKKQALKRAKDEGETFKIQLIGDIPDDETVTEYTQGDFTDVCRGPHMRSTGMVKAFKLTRIAGAYFKGDSKNKMLTRIYGVAFDKKSEMDEYFVRQEEAMKRDHNKLGRELEIFTTVDYIGQGLPILLPKGTAIVQTMQRFVEDEEAKRGWVRTKTPLMAKSDLYKISGHWDHYKDGMFVLGDEKEDKEVFALRPMTCPFQYQAYLNRARSYKDLPMRLAETSTLFRNESSGEMHGLIRVRQFTISEGHLMCTPEQLESEFKGCLELAIFMLKTMGLYEDASYRFSQWDPNDRDKYIGTVEQWEEAQGKMKTILDNLGIPYKVGVGEAAFYGPKLDIQIKNVWGKEDTLITIQIDQMLAEKFGMEYTDKDGNKKNPYIIHRTSIGCYERTLAYLIEKYAGAFPLWLAPVQLKVINVSEKSEDYAREVSQKLALHGYRIENDFRSEKVGYKIRQAQLEKVPYMMVLGENEIAAGTVTLRKRNGEEIRDLSIEQVVEIFNKEIEEKIK